MCDVKNARALKYFKTDLCLGVFVLKLFPEDFRSFGCHVFLFSSVLFLLYYIILSSMLRDMW